VKGSRAVAKTYAKALFELAKDRGQAEPIGEELARLAQVVAGAPELAAFLSRPWVGIGVKRATAAEVANRVGVTPLARDFFTLVVAHGRATHLEAIATAYRDLVDADAGRIRARVRAAVSLGADERETLATRIGRELGVKQVVLEETIDPALMGGFVAEVGSLVVDGSLDGQLARLKQRLATA
jgi:F-type H+-transporting ATPase subunit delta